MTHAACPCCGGSSGEPAGAWVRCHGCGHRWRLLDTAPAAHYQQMIARNDTTSDAFQRKLADRLDTLLPLLPETDQDCRVLEVGCAEGHLGAALKAVRPMTYDGIEISRDADAAAARIDSVFRHPAAELIVPAYNMLLSFHVLEHIAEPAAELLEWRRLLAPNGRMVVEVPHEGGHPLVLSDENAEHLHQFTFASLLCLLQRAGFEVDAVSGGHYESAVYADSLRVAARVRESTASRTDRLVARFKQRMGGGPFLIYGIGGDFRNYVLPVLDQLPVRELLDSSADKWGATVSGHVIGRYDAQHHAGMVVLVCSVRFKSDIVASLRALDIPDALIVTLDEVY
jgi:SAM-dependent methyltransferase